MATITKINFLKEGLGGGQGVDGFITQDQILRVEFSGVITTVREAISTIASAGFRIGSQHPIDPIMFLVGDIGAEALDDSIGDVWDFELSYSTVGPNPHQNSNTGSYRPEVVPGSWTYTRVVDRDKETGEAFLNPAGDPIDPLPIEVISAPTLTITIQEYGDHISRLNLVGSINSGGLSIAGLLAPKYCVMFDKYTTKPFWDEEGFLTFRNTFFLKFKYYKNEAGNEIGFKLESVEQGFNQIVGGEKEAIKIPDEDGNLVLTSIPLMLNAAGAVTDTPFYKERVSLDLIDFSQFALPTSFPVI